MTKTGGHCWDVSRSKRLGPKSDRTVLRSQTQTNRQNQWRENNEVRPAETVNGRVPHTTGLLGWREEGAAVLVKRWGAAGPGNLGHQLLSVHHHEAKSHHLWVPQNGKVEVDQRREVIGFGGKKSLLQPSGHSLQLLIPTASIY